MRRRVQVLDPLGWLPGALMAGVAVADLLVSGEAGLLPLFVVGPALAAASGPVRRVVLNGVLAAGLCMATSWANGRFGHTRLWVALAAIALATAAACYVSCRRRRTEQELVAVHSVADTIQQVVLTTPPRVAGPVRLTSSYVCADRTALIGGDLFHAVVDPSGANVRTIVADVQGKGLPAVRGAVVVLAAFEEAAVHETDLDTVRDRIEQALERRTDGDRFVTAVLAETRADGTVLLLNCGHPAPLVLRRTGDVETAAPAAPGPPIGLGTLTDAQPGRSRLTLRPGDRVLFYTDGLTEARDPDGDFYPAAARAARFLAEPDPDRALERLREDVRRFTRGSADDDSALLLLDFPGALPRT